MLKANSTPKGHFVNKVKPQYEKNQWWGHFFPLRVLWVLLLSCAISSTDHSLYNHIIIITYNFFLIIINIIAALTYEGTIFTFCFNLLIYMGHWSKFGFNQCYVLLDSSYVKQITSYSLGVNLKVCLGHVFCQGVLCNLL